MSTRSGWTSEQDAAYLSAFAGKTDEEIAAAMLAINKQLNAFDDQKAVLLHQHALLRRKLTGKQRLTNCNELKENG